MIEREICGNYFHPDEIRSCPNPNCLCEDLCESCYEKHLEECNLGNAFTDSDE